MDARLAELAQRLHDCKKLGNRMILANILESANILTEAKEISGNKFHVWLKEAGVMDRTTVRRHLRVARFVAENEALTPELAKLSIAKVYALTTLDYETARGYLTGKITLSKPLDMMNDLEFAREFRIRHPARPKAQNAKYVYREVYGAMVRLRKKLSRAGKYANRLTPAQHRKIVQAFEGILNEAAGWEVVA